MTALPGMGGSALSTAALARGLGQLGWEVHIATIAPAYAAGELNETTPLTALVRTGQDPYGTWWHTPAAAARHEALPDDVLRWPRYCAALESLTDELQPQILNPHYIAPYLNACLEAAQGNYPVVASMHGTDVSEPPSGLASQLSKALRRCSATTAVSHWLAQEAAHTYTITPPVAIHNWLPDLPTPNSREQRAHTRRTHGLAHYEYLAVHASNLRGIKRAHICVEAVAQLRKDGVHAGLAIVGDGPERERVIDTAKELSIEEHVHVLGARRDSGSVISAADIIWLPSRSEGLSRVAIEAHAGGVGVVSTGGSGIEEVVIDGVTGRLTEAHDPEAFVKAAQETSHDPSLATTARETGPQVAQAFSETAHTVEAYDRLFTSLSN